MRFLHHEDHQGYQAFQPAGSEDAEVGPGKYEVELGLYAGLQTISIVFILHRRHTRSCTSSWCLENRPGSKEPSLILAKASLCKKDNGFVTQAGILSNC